MCIKTSVLQIAYVSRDKIWEENSEVSNVVFSYKERHTLTADTERHSDL